MAPAITWAEEPNLVEIRTMFYEAAFDKQLANTFLDRIENMETEANSTMLGYHGMAYMLQAKFAWNPYNKVKHFLTGKSFLEHAIELDTSNVELRYLRFCIQTNAPFFLGYNNALSSDKELILKSWQALNDDDLKTRIRDYMLNSGECSASEKEIFYPYRHEEYGNTSR